MTFPAPSRRAVLSMLMAIAMITGTALAVRAQAAQAAKPAKPKGTVIRGCLNGSKLLHIDPEDSTLNLPDVLRVSSLKVIRSQIKALDGHQVELIGSLENIPGQDRSVLVGDSDKAKVYVGGGDKKLGDDLGVDRGGPPTIYARTVKDIADKCPGVG